MLTGRDEMSNLNRGPYIYTSYQVMFHLANLFQIKIFLEIAQPEIRTTYGGL